MAPQTNCSMCKKESGLIHCTGCNEHFCWHDLKVHREKLVKEMDEIVEESKCLKEQVGEDIKVSIMNHDIIKEINEWEKKTIEKVKQVAGNMRDKLTNIHETNRAKITLDCDEFFKELGRLQETQNYAEIELERLRLMLGLLKNELDQPTTFNTIQLHTVSADEIPWKKYIYLGNLKTNTDNESEKFEQEQPVMSKSIQIFHHHLLYLKQHT